eukprot:UN13583
MTNNSMKCVFIADYGYDFYFDYPLYYIVDLCYYDLVFVEVILVDLVC